MYTDTMCKHSCGHVNPVIERTFDSGFYYSSYKICKDCKELNEFKMNVVSERKIEPNSPEVKIHEIRLQLNKLDNL